MKKAIKKFKSKRGFSLSELLVALLIVSLMTVGLAYGVSSSLRVYKEAVWHAEERTLLSTLSEAVMSELRSARKVELENKSVKNLVDQDGNPISDDCFSFTFTSPNFGTTKTSFSKDDQGKAVLIYTDSSGKPATKKLVGDGAYAKNSLIKVEDILTGYTESEGKGAFWVNIKLESGEFRSFKISLMTDDAVFNYESPGTE